MNLDSPNTMLYLLLLAPLLVVAFAWGGYRRRKRIERWIPDGELAEELTRSVSPGRRRWRQGLFGAGIVLVVLALARPQWGTHLVRSPSHSRDVLVVLDTSRSMLARDISPSRLQHAKLLVRRLVEAFPGDRFGLIAFAGEAFLECPLTQNRSGFLLFLAETDTGTIPVGGTNLQRALEMALEAFKAAEGRNRGVLLITDGEEVQGDASTVLDTFREQNIPIFVVGLGDPVIGSYIQLEGNEFVTDAEGNRVRTRLNEDALQRISAAVGGSYVQSTVAYDGIDHLIDRVGDLIPAEQQAETTVRPIERYQLPLLIALLVLIVRLGMGERREVEPVASRLAKGEMALALVVAMLIGVTALGQQAPPSPPPPAPTPEAQAAAERFERRVNLYENRLEHAETGLEKAFCHYNLGVLFQRAGELDRAGTHYEQALDLAGEADELRARTYQNLGVMRHDKAMAQAMQSPDDALAGLTEAESHYREALRYGQLSQDVAANQQQLLKHRRMVEQIKQMQEQQPEQSQQAQDQVKEALQEQQKANEMPPGEQKQRQQQQAKQKNEEAQQNLQQMSEQMREQGMEEAAEKLDEVREQMKQAQADQEQALEQERPLEERQQAGEEAEEKLATAAEQMSGEQQEQEEGQPEDAGDEGESTDDQEPEESSLARDEPPEDGQQSREGQGEPADLQDFSRMQALRLLEEMQESERDLKQELKKKMVPARPGAEPEKNW